MLKLCWDVFSSNKQWSSFMKARFLRNFRPISYYLQSFIWPAMKAYYPLVKQKSSWRLSDGKIINFWLYKWFTEPIATSPNFPVSRHSSLRAKVCEFIVNGQWRIPAELSTKCPNVVSKIQNQVIPSISEQDILVWSKSKSGFLTFKEAYLFLNLFLRTCSWGKSIWSISIPPSRSFLLWRLIYKKLSTDDNLQLRGCTIVSMCSQCSRSAKFVTHLFLESPYAVYLWNWSSNILHRTIDLSFVSSCLNTCFRN